MANYFSLPLEIRQQILQESFHASAEHAREGHEARRNSTVPFDQYIRAGQQKAEEWRNNFKRVYDFDNTILKDVDSRSVNSLAYCPAVYRLVENLSAAHTPIITDRGWALKAWRKEERKRRVRVKKLRTEEGLESGLFPK